MCLEPTWGGRPKKVGLRVEEEEEEAEVVGDGELEEVENVIRIRIRPSISGGVEARFVPLSFSFPLLFSFQFSISSSSVWVERLKQVKLWRERDREVRLEKIGKLKKGWWMAWNG